MSIKNIVSDLIKEHAGSSYSWQKGDVVDHPDGYKVRIDDGFYLDPRYGRVSNFWYWTVLDGNGQPTDQTAHGYGW